MPENPAAGWYPDPHDPARMRYWDGNAWTNHRTPVEGGQSSSDAGAEPTVPLAQAPQGGQSQPAPPARQQPAQQPRRGARQPAPSVLVSSSGPEAGNDVAWYKRWWAAGAAGLVVGLLLGVGAANAGDSDNGATDVDAPTATTTVTATVTAEPEPEPEEAESVEPSEPVTTKKPAKPKSQVGGSSDAGNSDTFVMPNEVGKTLQAAQDDLQAVSGNPLFYSASDDATGAGRGQWIDSGWQVCSQNRAPGSKVSVDDTSIVFSTVRVSENCP